MVLFPLLGIALSIFLLIKVFHTVCAIRYSHCSNPSSIPQNRNVKNRIHYQLVKLFCFLLATVCFAIVGFNGLKFSIVLDRENHFIETSGTINKIDTPHQSYQFYYNGTIVRGNYIDVGNERFFIITIGDLSVGDEVHIHYLPHSKVVLYIEPI